MTSSCHFTIERWSAWAPSLGDLNSWQDWASKGSALPIEEACLNLAEVPASLRRRCSKFGRAALRSLYAVLPPDARATMPTVVASRHGESERMLALLTSLARDEMLSPMDFSLSVHNATAGIFSIAASNRTNISAVASAGSPLIAGLLESAALADRAGQVACVVAEEPLPHIFRMAGAEYPYVSLALLLSFKDQRNAASITIQMCDKEGKCSLCPTRAPGTEMLQWLLSKEAQLVLRDQGVHWLLEKNDCNFSFATHFAEGMN